MIQTIKEAKVFLLNKYKKFDITTHEGSNKYFYIKEAKVNLPISKDELSKIYERKCVKNDKDRKN